jgi:hypothetical protein
VKGPTSDVRPPTSIFRSRRELLTFFDRYHRLGPGLLQFLTPWTRDRSIAKYLVPRQGKRNFEFASRTPIEIPTHELQPFYHEHLCQRPFCLNKGIASSRLTIFFNLSKFGKKLHYFINHNHINKNEKTERMLCPFVVAEAIVVVVVEAVVIKEKVVVVVVVAVKEKAGIMEIVVRKTWWWW